MERARSWEGSGGGSLKTLRQAPDACYMTWWAGQPCSQFPLEDVSTGRQTVLPAGVRPRVPIYPSCSPAENSVLARREFPKTPSASVFLIETVVLGSSRPSSCSPEAG